MDYDLFDRVYNRVDILDDFLLGDEVEVDLGEYVTGEFVVADNEDAVDYYENIYSHDIIFTEDFMYCSDDD